MGDVIVRLTVNKKNGTYDAKILGHDGGSTCGDGIDEDIIEDLLNAEVPEFGQMVNPEDSGHTSEYFDEKKGKQSPHKYHQDEDEEDGDEEKTDNKKLDLGYGV